MKTIFSLVLIFIFVSSTWAQQVPCEDGKEWNSNLNRCTLKQSVITTQQTNNACVGITDTELRRQCLENAINTTDADAAGASVVASQNKTIDKMATYTGKSSVVLSTTVVFMTTYVALTHMKDKKKCEAMSYKAMLAAAVALAGGEIATYITYKKNLKKALDKYKNTLSTLEANTSTMNADEKNVYGMSAQTAAYDFMKDKDDAVIKAMTTKKNIYNAAAAAYGLAVVLGAYEMYSQKSPTENQCFMDEKSKDPIAPKTVFDINYTPKDISSFVSHYSKYIFPMFLIASAHAQETDLMRKAEKELKESSQKDLKEVFGALLGASTIAGSSTLLKNGKVGLPPIANDISAAFKTSATRMVFSVLLGGYAKLVAEDAKNQIEAANARKNVYTNLVTELNGAGNTAYCKPEDRNNPAKGSCYCYTPDNLPNAARAKDPACNIEFGGGPKKPNNYTIANNAPVATDTQGCVNNQNNLDANCECKLKNKCFKMPEIKLNNPHLNSLGANVGKFIDGMTNGSMLGANINPASFMNLNKALRDAKDKVLAKVKGANSSSLKKAEAQLHQRLSTSAAASPIAINGVSNSSLTASAPEANAKPEDVKKEIQKEIELVQKSLASSASGAGKNADGDIFGFGDSSEPGVKIEGEEVAQVMDANFNYGNSDISTDKSANIFDILSVRYQRSALKRIFGNANEGTVDKPDETDISK